MDKEGRITDTRVLLIEKKIEDKRAESEKEEDKQMQTKGKMRRQMENAFFNQRS